MVKNDCVIEYQLNEIDLPIKKGNVVGSALLVKNGQVVGKTELVSTCDVDKKPYLDYLKEIVA